MSFDSMSRGEVLNLWRILKTKIKTPSKIERVLNLKPSPNNHSVSDATSRVSFPSLRFSGYNEEGQVTQKRNVIENDQVLKLYSLWIWTTGNWGLGSILSLISAYLELHSENLLLSACFAKFNDITISMLNDQQTGFITFRKRPSGLQDDTKIVVSWFYGRRGVNYIPLISAYLEQYPASLFRRT